LLVASAFAADAGGYAEVRGHLHLGVDDEVWELVEHVRPAFDAELGDRWAMSTVVDVGFHQGRDLEALASELVGYEVVSEANDLLGVSTVTDYLAVDRLYVDAYLPGVDFRAGRQAVNWGSGLVLNATDPFPELLATEPWRPRAGVNALKATVPIGDRHEVQAVVGADDAFTDVKAALRGTVNAGGTDFSLIGAYRDDAMVGVDMKGTLGVGWWVEAAYILDSEPHDELAIGIDYSFPVLQTLMVMAQYNRLGDGSTDISASTAMANMASGDSIGLAGRDYGIAMVSLAATYMLSFSALHMQNLNDGSAYSMPSVAVAPNSWLELSAAAQIPWAVWGEGGELAPSEADLVVDIPQVGELDLDGLMPDATFIFWTRAYF
ncbi:MAG: hypothetical protein GY913_08040, partial [Proteobacteria bacterium]|nr:hypothetical protein [Pseudomonadota bacterium]